MHHTSLALQCTFFKHILQIKTVLQQMHAQKQAGNKMQLLFSIQYKCIENTAK